MGVAPQPSSAAQDYDKLKQQMDASKSGTDREQLPGAAIYHARCQACHEGQAPKAPSRTFVEMMTPEAIYGALSVGIMQRQATGLDDADKRHVAEYLSGVAFGAKAPPLSPPCTGAAERFDTHRAPDAVGFGFVPENTHFIRAEAAELPAETVTRLKLKWTVAFPATVRVRSQPSFAYGALYVGSQSGTVYALDAKQGCVRWEFHTTAEVRTAVVVPDQQGRLKQAFFGDLIGRVYALDATTGRELWRTRVEDHPSATITAAPLYRDGTLYVGVSSLEEGTADPKYPCCSFRGSVVALDAASGKVRWKRYTIDETPHRTGTTKLGTPILSPSGAAVWNAPTYDAKRQLIYVGTGNNYTGPADDRSNEVLALRPRDGSVAWRWQIVSGDAWNVGCMVGLGSCPEHSGPDSDIGSGTVLGKLADGSDRLLIGLKSGVAFSVDPDSHDHAIWHTRLGRGSIQGGIQFGMAYDGKRLYVPIADMGNSMDSSTHQQDVSVGPPKPGLYALDPASGKILWSAPAPEVCGGRANCDAGILAAISAIPGVVFAGHMDGWLRAYDSTNGHVIWQFDTTQPQVSLGGVAGHGGSIGGAGPVVHDGMLYADSGYGLYFHMPGNVLMAFSVDGK
jgi:polyvinyl alcohol dehydrogenase (cytochrome)